MIVFENVTKKFSNDLIAVNNISFEVKKGEILVLLGTSGSGKTTTMRMINRLDEPNYGKITIEGQDIKTLDPIALRRKIGYAIQYIGLFNYMSVKENISIVLKLLKWDQKKIDKRVDEMLLLFGFDPKEYRHRYPHQLSGGEKQRIGVARALACDPPIVLMDEPFGALDPITREDVRNEFLELESDIKKTVVFVTHDVFEAVKIADRIALMDHGKILQIATPKRLVENPENEFVEKFLQRHKFQLSLLTTQIKDFVKKPENIEVPLKDIKEKLKPKDSVIDALDQFKQTNKSKIPVLEKNIFLGYLHKNDLLNSIFEILKENEKI
ncbi:MAG: ATP-binding cassette domain-containing protein [Parachlamydiales bacterium]|nr:ATP-binding cassette domain-containing protein [Parachlamydiales bacterium]